MSVATLKGLCLPPAGLIRSQCYFGRAPFTATRRLYFSQIGTKRHHNVFVLAFWQCKKTWKRASVNTFRCLIGCSIGDFGALWILHGGGFHLSMKYMMIIPMSSGIVTSVILESVLLRFGQDRMGYLAALETALGMSLISMLAMEAVETSVNLYLTGGMVNMNESRFWTAAVIAALAGYMAPLPYNYFRIKRYGISCH